MKITAHRLTGLFGAPVASLQLLPAALQLDHRPLDWLDIPGLPALDRGFFFAALAWPSGDGVQRIHWLNKTRAAEAHLLACRYWCQAHAPGLARLAQHVQQQLNLGYLRQQQFRQLQARASAELQRWPKEHVVDWLTDEQHQALGLLHKLSRWTAAELRAHQQRYIAREKQQFQAFFAGIESNPLTDSQQDACIKDEANNLVLAGAGTGKTSTLIGRAGYLLASGQARAGESLLLAFGNKAADEMAERLTKRLNTADITATTFHSLGRTIIAAVEGEQPALSPLAEDDRRKQKWLQQALNALLATPDYQALLHRHLAASLTPSLDPFAFASEGDYYRSLNQHHVRSLKGEAVRDIGELRIAKLAVCPGHRLSLPGQLRATLPHPRLSTLPPRLPPADRGSLHRVLAHGR